MKPITLCRESQQFLVPIPNHDCKFDRISCFLRITYNYKWMGSSFNCCRSRQELIDFDGLAELDADLAGEIQQMRKDHSGEFTQSKEIVFGKAIFRGNLDIDKMKTGYGELYKQNLAFFGYFEDDKPHGYGILIKGEEQYYRGEFSKGQYHGKGREFSQQHEFQGDFQNGSRKKGILRTSRMEYQGEFKDNLFDGRGSLRLLDGSSYEGIFKAGKYDGKGFITFANSNKYEGLFENGKYHGSGKFVWSDGIAAFCEFDQGVRTQRELIANRNLAKTHIPNPSKIEAEGESNRRLRWFDYTQIPKVVNGNGMLYLY